MCEHIFFKVIGDKSIGKTSLLRSYFSGYFPDPNYPHNHPFTNGEGTELINYQGKLFSVAAWDAYEEKFFRKVERESYRDYHVIVICFSLVSPKSLDNVYSFWINEIKSIRSYIPYILVGLKSDLRDEYFINSKAKLEDDCCPIPTYKGEEVKQVIGAKRYVECSALTRNNLDEFFNSVVDVYFEKHRLVRVEPQNTHKVCEVF